MTVERAGVVICGAGIAGISTAYHLAVRKGVQDVLLVDDRAPMSLTSDKSTECYRNWWPGPGDAMVAMMNRSIDILEELAAKSNNAFHMNRRGYLFATSNASRIPDFIHHAREAEILGAGPLRIHDGSSPSPYQPAPLAAYDAALTGADLITDRELIRKHFDYLSPDTLAVIHPRRCGWFSAQQLGMLMLQEAKDRGVRLVQGRVVGVQLHDGRVESVLIAAGGTTSIIKTDHFVNAAGPHLRSVANLIGVDVPVYAELHTKVSIQDHLGVFPRQAPLVIWSDPLYLPWTEEEKRFLAAEEDDASLLAEFPEGVHARPDGPDDSPVILILWTYHTEAVDPVFPISTDPVYPEIALRGLARMIPGLEAYFERPPKPFVDGGYYTKTEENRPLIGPLPPQGTWIIGALSGFGLMAAPACGELLAAHITGDRLPPYADWFTLSRYERPEYQELLKSWGRSGQL